MAARLYHVLLLCAVTLHAQGTVVTQDPGDYEVMLEQDVLVQDVTDRCPVGCTCLQLSYPHTMKVTCKAYKGTSLPATLPSLKNGSSYELDFTNSHLSSIDYRPYLENTTKLLLSHSDVTSVSRAAWHAWACDVTVLRLDANSLQRLPAGFEEDELHHVMELHLEDNPWVCDCDALSFRQFLVEHGHVVKGDVTCHSPSHVAGRKVIDVGVDEFCTDPQVDIMPYLVAAAVVFIVVLVVVTILVLRMRK